MTSHHHRTLEAVAARFGLADVYVYGSQADAIAVTAEEREAANLVVQCCRQLPALARTVAVVDGAKRLLSGEFTPLPLDDVIKALRAREAAGSITLVPGGGRK